MGGGARGPPVHARLCAKLAFWMVAIMDLHKKGLAYVVIIIFIEFLDLENIYLDTKIVFL